MESYSCSWTLTYLAQTETGRQRVTLPVRPICSHILLSHTYCIQLLSKLLSLFGHLIIRGGRVQGVFYRAKKKKSLYVVWWNLFLLLLITSASTCLQPRTKTSSHLCMSPNNLAPPTRRGWRGIEWWMPELDREVWGPISYDVHSCGLRKQTLASTLHSCWL